MGLQAGAAEKFELLDQVDYKRIKISRKWAILGGGGGGGGKRR